MIRITFYLLATFGFVNARPQSTDSNEVAERFYGGGSNGVVGSQVSTSYTSTYYQQGGYPSGYYPSNFQSGNYQGSYQGAYPGGFNQGFQSLAPTGVVGTCPSTFGPTYPSGGIRARRQESETVETRSYGGGGNAFGGGIGIGGGNAFGGGYGVGACYTDYDCSGRFICCSHNGIKQCVQPVY